MTEDQERAQIAMQLDMLICIASLPELEQVDHRAPVLRSLPPPVDQHLDPALRRKHDQRLKGAA